VSLCLVKERLLFAEHLLVIASRRTQFEVTLCWVTLMSSSLAFERTLVDV
jgi:hypothetical protein